LIDGGADIRLRHERLADEHGVNSTGLQPQGVGACANAAFGDKNRLGGNLLLEPERMLQINDKGAQVPIIDPDQSGTSLQDARQIGRLVQFDERGHPQVDRAIVQGAQLAIVETFGDQQDGIGAASTGFQQLIGIEDEVLAQ